MNIRTNQLTNPSTEKQVILPEFPSIQTTITNYLHNITIFSPNISKNSSRNLFWLTHIDQRRKIRLKQENGVKFGIPVYA